MPRFPSGSDNYTYSEDKRIDWVHYPQIHCKINNQTQHSWYWEDFRLAEQSSIVPGPDYRSEVQKVIHPGQSTVLHLTSEHSMYGVEVWITYRTDAGPLEFHWNVPRVGGNSYHTYKIPAEFMSIHNSGDENTNNTTVRRDNDGFGNSISGTHPRFEWTIKQRPPAAVKFTDHFYTIDADSEEAKKSGYQFEGILGYVFPTKEPNSVPFYRFYNSVTGDHFYTSNPDAEGSTGYALERIECYLTAPGDTREIAIPIYRWFGNGQHFYTTEPQGEAAASSGYKLDGEAGLIFSEGASGYTVPLYRWRLDKY